MLILQRFVIFLFAVILLSSCSEKRFSAIPEDLSVAATINIKDMSVSFIDLDKMERLVDWKLGKPYTGAVIFPDGDTILLFGKQVETADLYSLKTGKSLGVWRTGKGIVNGKLLQTSAEIALVDQNQNKIRFFNLKGEEQGQISTEQNPLTILEAVKDKKLFVLSFNKKQLTVIDLVKKEKMAGFQIHPSAAGAWLNENKNELWIGGHGAGIEIETDIHVYDSVSGDFKFKLPAPLMPVNFLGKENLIYVLSHGSNMLYKLNEEGEVIDAITVGANPFEMVFTGENLLIAGYDSNDIHIIDPDKMTIIKTIAVGDGPFQMVLRERS
ncbi:WD40 repeat domain-containing protein [Bacillus sp. FJAT-29790]|uniref:WD40 repeat domain-containing protein n=1 Tax=Bacillus sp. FJAT-29790 TaxID=1895002 RepID=UPI001C21F18C|nr:WD40 repeat domain-containing protein [Bacillus sp. FJAT-29790]MBU8878917.1 WD40 repeat domain-containing protein [Bacillus sp. FJAT-29790]